LKQVESMIGFPLFERRGRAARLTDPGSSLLGFARTVLQALQDADQALTAMRGITTGRVTLGLVSTAKYFVPHIVAAFNAEYPGIRIHLRDGNRLQILAAVASGEIDLAIGGRPPDEMNLGSAPFASHPSVIIAPRGHPLAMDAGSIAPARLAGEPLIIREEGSGTRNLMERFLADADLPLRPVITTSSNEMIKQAVMARIGLALISRHTIGLELALGLLKILAVEGFPLMRSWFVIQRAERPLLPIQERLQHFILQNGEAVIARLEEHHARTATERPDQEHPGGTERRRCPDKSQTAPPLD
jgi:DNA-binding transcriptional LysR family regulator